MEPALEPCVDCENDQQPVSQETFLTAFKKVLENIVAHLREQLVIVAHTENTYDGSAIRGLLASKFETEKVCHFSACSNTWISLLAALITNLQYLTASCLKHHIYIFVI